MLSMIETVLKVTNNTANPEILLNPINVHHGLMDGFMEHYQEVMDKG